MNIMNLLITKYVSNTHSSILESTTKSLEILLKILLEPTCEISNLISNY